MIVIKLWGGTGNQLFQYAFGYMLSKDNYDNLEFDTAFYKNQSTHVAKRFYVTKVIFPNFNFNYSFTRPKFLKIIENRYISHAIRRLGGIYLKFPKYSLFIEKLRHFHPRIPYIKEKINYYDGYWQSAKYFEKYRKDLLELFSPTERIINYVREWRASLPSENIVGVHIRRGDYVKSNKPNKFLLGIEYYKNAIDILRGKLDSPLFCIFSDDIDWCRTQFPEIDDIIYVENRVENGDIIDLFSIAACEHGIMSLSTFSWWGNWLRRNQNDAIVVYPEKVYFNEFFIPENWICINKLMDRL
ncbi:MAG: alpha-1,2-fucosyltransferase [Muribaculaceae bacterium]|nr:alpha-1,2-fucosyltransferase [Muribaculaceae bacterium]